MTANIDTRKGWIKLWRDFWESGLYKSLTSKQVIVLMYIISQANHKEAAWIYGGEEYIVKPGQLITSVQSITNGIDKHDITVRVVRTALERLEKANVITRKTSNKNTLITVLNWEIYQNVSDVSGKQNDSEDDNQADKQDDKQVTNKLTTNKNTEEFKNNIKEEGEKKKDNSPSPIPTLEDIRDFSRTINGKVDVEKFFNYYKNKGWKIHGESFDWREKFREWEKTEYRKPQNVTEFGFKNRFLNYEQPQYTDEQWELIMKRKMEKQRSGG